MLYHASYLTPEKIARYVLPPEVDLHHVKDNLVVWMSLADRLGKTVCAHFCWTNLLAALEHGGPTAFVFENLMRIIDNYPGLRSMSAQLVGAAGDRVQSVRSDAVDLFVRHHTLDNLHVFSDSFLHLWCEHKEYRDLHTSR